MVRKLRNIELNRLTIEEFKTSPKWPLVVVLDNVRSMLNVGSIFRTCDAFNVEHLYLTGITPKPPHREISKTAIGAELAVNWSYEEHVVEVISKLKEDGFAVYGIEQAAESISLDVWQPHRKDRLALVFGHEIDGVSQPALDSCDGVIEISQFGTKHSLNVSVSAGVVLWQACLSQLEYQRELK